MLAVKVALRRGSFTLDAAFDAPTPGVLALFGASGCGKTTLIQLLAGLLRPDAGRIEVDGALLFDAGRVDIAPERRAIGYVFQDARLFPAPQRARQPALWRAARARPRRQREPGRRGRSARARSSARSPHPSAVGR
jgi:ABC-type molybdate transport system ATPase subunit